MCLNPKRLIKNGIYQETNYNGQKGEEYFIDTLTKCGYCQECQNEKSNNWVIRNWYESQTVKDACFITLTYKENPIILIKKHAQDFMKRLRRHLEYHYNITNLRFFLAGEYGTLNHRPHLHVIIYNWKEENEKLKYLGINKKGNIILESETIKKTWGFGRTTYQIFDTHEIPYITLYQTPKLEESYYYRIHKEKAKKLLKELKEKNQEYFHHRCMIYEIEKELKLQAKSKSEYLKIKEFNLWSVALGWNNFEKNYCKYQNNYDWKEYIEDKVFTTPSAWVKKLANLGYHYAIEEMQRRATLLNSNSEEEEKAQRNSSYYKKNIQDITKHKQTIYIM